MAVAFVGGAIAGIAAGGIAHAHALGALGAVVVSAGAVAVVVGTLWFLRRTERRDPSMLALYPTASVGRLGPLTGAWTGMRTS